MQYWWKYHHHIPLVETPETSLRSWKEHSSNSTVLLQLRFIFPVFLANNHSYLCVLTYICLFFHTYPWHENADESFIGGIYHTLLSTRDIYILYIGMTQEGYRKKKQKQAGTELSKATMPNMGLETELIKNRAEFQLSYK